jgi:hypothetical protein
MEQSHQKDLKVYAAFPLIVCQISALLATTTRLRDLACSRQTEMESMRNQLEAFHSQVSVIASQLAAADCSLTNILHSSDEDAGSTLQHLKVRNIWNSVQETVEVNQTMMATFHF